MIGMNAKTGGKLSGIDHLKQSMMNIITTPIGSRVMRRNYGSTLHLFYDTPMDDFHLAQIQAAIINALMINEPRIKVLSVKVLPNTNNSPTNLGKLLIDIEAMYIQTNEIISITDMKI